MTHRVIKTLILLTVAPYLAATPASAQVMGPQPQMADLTPTAPSPRRPSLLARWRANFAKFRPTAWDQTKSWAELSRLRFISTSEKIFHPEMNRRMEAQYEGAVSPLEREFANAPRRASMVEIQRYEHSRSEMANWTLKEIGKDQLKDFLRKRKSESAALGVVAATSGLEDTKKNQADAVAANQRTLMTTAPTPEQEEEIPTKVKTRLNILKGQGQVTLVNPVVTTMVEAQAGGDALAVEMNRGFNKLKLDSRLRYAVDKSQLVFNVNKKITNEVSLDLNSERWTGSKRSSEGLKGKDTAKLLYSISF